MRTIQVKNAANLIAILRAYPNARVQTLISNPGEDCWSVDLTEEKANTVLPVAGFTVKLIPEEGTSNKNEVWDKALQEWENIALDKGIEDRFRSLKGRIPGLQGFTLQITKGE